MTKLPLIRGGIYLSLYLAPLSCPSILPLYLVPLSRPSIVVLDLFSRFAVAFFRGIDGLAQGEQRSINAPWQRTLATQLMDEVTARHGIAPGQLTLHQERGSPMLAQGYLDAMRELDVTCSHSRPG